MARKKKYHGGLLVFCCLLLVFLLGNTCFATVSEDFFDYAIDTLATTFVETGNGGSKTTQIRNRLASITDEQKATMFTQLTAYMSTNGLSNLDENNILFYAYLYSNDSFYLIACINNATSPHGVEHLDFASVNNTTLKPYTNTTTDFLYCARWQLYFNGSSYYDTVRLQKNGYTIFDAGTYEFLDAHTIFSSSNIACSNGCIGYASYPLSSSTRVPVHFTNTLGTWSAPVEPDTPSGDSGGLGDITNNSGDTTGNVNLTPIIEGIGNIQNQISGDTQKVIDNQNQNTQTIVNALSGETEKITNTLTESADSTIDNTTITSGDITSSLGFSLMQNPYSNFWYEMTQGLGDCLTNSVRSIPVNWLGYNGYFNLDGLINYPTSIKTILTTVSTVAMVWLLVKWWKIIIDKLTSGNVEEVLEMNEEEGIIDLF